VRRGLEARPAYARTAIAWHVRQATTPWGAGVHPRARARCAAPATRAFSGRGACVVRRVFARSALSTHMQSGVHFGQGVSHATPCALQGSVSSAAGA
jgi:hypothetical protein